MVIYEDFKRWASSHAKTLNVLLAIIVCLLFMYFIWPTPYFYVSGIEGTMRISRLTGETQILSSDGEWTSSDDHMSQIGAIPELWICLAFIALSLGLGWYIHVKNRTGAWAEKHEMINLELAFIVLSLLFGLYYAAYTYLSNSMEKKAVLVIQSMRPVIGEDTEPLIDDLNAMARGDSSANFTRTAEEMVDRISSIVNANVQVIQAFQEDALRKRDNEGPTPDLVEAQQQLSQDANNYQQQIDYIKGEISNLNNAKKVSTYPPYVRMYDAEIAQLNRQLSDILHQRDNTLANDANNIKTEQAASNANASFNESLAKIDDMAVSRLKGELNYIRDTNVAKDFDDLSYCKDITLPALIKWNLAEDEYLSLENQMKSFYSQLAYDAQEQAGQKGVTFNLPQPLGNE